MTRCMTLLLLLAAILGLRPRLKSRSLHGELLPGPSRHLVAAGDYAGAGENAKVSCADARELCAS